jgi:Flp pilus assembly protein TadG
MCGNKVLPSKGERGAALIEFAAVLPLLMMILTGILAYGVVFNNYVILTDSTDIGARVLAVSRGQTLDPCALAANAVYTAAPTLTRGSLAFSFVFNGVTYIGNTCSSTSTTTGAAGNLVQGAPAQVTVTYPCSLGVYGLAAGTVCSLRAQTTEVVQ